MVTKAPLDLWGNLTARGARLEVAVGCLSLATLLLAGLVVWHGWRGTPVYFVPPGGPGLARPGEVPEAVATDYAARVLMARYTFTPATVAGAHRAVLQALHPTLSVAFEAQAKREAGMVKEVALASQLHVLDATVSRRDGPRVTVHLDARRTIWVGGVEVRTEPVQADLTLTRWHSHGLPVGLVVIGVTVTPALSISGS